MMNNIRYWPDPVLNQKCSAVESFDLSLKELVLELFQAMHSNNGVGMAASQLGVLKSVFVVDLSPYGPDNLEGTGFEKPTIFVNAKILEQSGQSESMEGCISLPGLTQPLKRANSILVEAQGLDGKIFETTAHGLYSHAILHEFDHTLGINIFDKLSSLKKDMIKRKWQKHQRKMLNA